MWDGFSSYDVTGFFTIAGVPFDMLDQEDLQTLPEAVSLMCIHEGPSEIEM